MFAGRVGAALAIGRAERRINVGAFVVAGMTIAPPPPSSIAMAGGSSATLVVVCALVCWLGRVPRPERN